MINALLMLYQVISDFSFTAFKTFILLFALFHQMILRMIPSCQPMLLVCLLMDITIHIDTISMDCPFCILRGNRSKFSYVSVSDDRFYLSKQ